MTASDIVRSFKLCIGLDAKFDNGMCTLMCKHVSFTVDYCHGIRDCSGHGTCREIPMNGPTNGARGFTCDCDQGFEGVYCDIQRCTGGSACMNGGLCRYALVVRVFYC